MKGIAILALSVPLAACAATTNAPLVENGYPRGSLAVAAIDRGDLVAAERRLTTDTHLDRDNPARLVNLAHVYAETGRTAEALALWEQVLTLEDEDELETLSGRETSTHRAARAALARYRTAALTN